MSINPDFAAAHRRLGFAAYAWRNDLQAAARHYERAIELSSEPTDAATMLFALGRIEESIPYYERIVVDNLLSVSAHYNLGLMYLFTGDPERASGRALIFHEFGQEAEFEQEVSRLIELSGEEYGSEVALVYAWAGDLDRAFYWLEKERESGAGSGWTQILGYPQSKNLAADPRWLPFLRSVGAAPEQLAAIEFNVPPLL